MKKVAVIGGGPAGMLAAAAAAERGHTVTLIEKNEKLGKKLFITGKGRCNITNAADTEEFFKISLQRALRIYERGYNCTAAKDGRTHQDRTRRTRVPGF